MHSVGFCGFGFAWATSDKTVNQAWRSRNAPNTARGLVIGDSSNRTSWSRHSQSQFRVTGNGSMCRRAAESGPDCLSYYAHSTVLVLGRSPRHCRILVPSSEIQNFCMETVIQNQPRASPQPSLLSPWNAHSASCAAARGEAFRQIAEQCMVGRRPGSLKRLLQTSLQAADSIRSCSCGSPPWKPKLETRNTESFAFHPFAVACLAAREYPRSVSNACWLLTNLKLTSTMHADSHESRGIQLPTWHCLI